MVTTTVSEVIHPALSPVAMYEVVTVGLAVTVGPVVVFNPVAGDHVIVAGALSNFIMINGLVADVAPEVVAQVTVPLPALAAPTKPGLPEATAVVVRVEEFCWHVCTMMFETPSQMNGVSKSCMVAPN